MRTHDATNSESDPCRDRTLLDFLKLAIADGIKQKSLFFELKLFFSPIFFGISIFYLFNQNIDTPFKLMTKYQDAISDCISNQTPNIPDIIKKYFKSFLKPSHKIRGVDRSLFLQLIVPTLSRTN
ncbi:hypothetical protein BD560DRAFT_420245 [Blakeslea trispora]|nr:hypothetical protein BD560DRAFT_420245 [Blakeslea trispora]